MLKLVNFSIKFFIIFALVSLFFTLSTFWYFSIGLPDYKKLSDYQPPISSRVYSNDGRLIAEYALEKRLFIPFESVPKKIINSLRQKKADPKKNIVLAECSLEKVKQNYNKNTKLNKNLTCVKGQVEKTLKIKKNLPKKISILRIDTDWYESTKVELEILFPLLSKNGFLIIDDYGYWSGAKKAVDNYFQKKSVSLFKIDFTSRFVIKK